MGKWEIATSEYAPAVNTQSSTNNKQQTADKLTRSQGITL